MPLRPVDVALIGYHPREVANSLNGHGYCDNQIRNLVKPAVADREILDNQRGSLSIWLKYEATVYCLKSGFDKPINLVPQRVRAGVTAVDAHALIGVAAGRPSRLSWVGSRVGLPDTGKKY